MEKEYPNFFKMLRESSLDPEDKTYAGKILGVKYNLFSETGMTDTSYFRKYPTIYHLRNYLVNETNKVDIRLVYLALHHIIKYRGNFLYEGDFANSTTEINSKLECIIEYLKEKYGITLKCSNETILDILKQKNFSKANKKDKLIACFNYEKEDKQVVVNIANAFLGYIVELKKIFDIEIEKTSISFSKEIENEEEIKSALLEEVQVYEAMSVIYSWYILQDILAGKNYISEAFKEKYEKYSKDLSRLKKVYKEYLPNEYKDMFRKNGTDNYVAYNGKSEGVTCKKCSPEKFFSELKKKIEKLPDNCKEKEAILTEISENNFLRKINVVDNGAIPNQLHRQELEKILENQAKYYPTLAENKSKIISLFSFRIPYYVGPLAQREEKWAWVVRKNGESIRPWNFEEAVDEDATAEKFIKRMTNKCTYIINEDVMPRQSLLYSEFCVLNELNNIRINNRHLSKDTKQKIIDKLFKKYKKVTVTRLKEFLKTEGYPCDNITGLTDGINFNSSLSSYIDMQTILGEVNEKQCENLINWITIFEEKKILRRKIKKEYPNLTNEQVEKLCKLRYTGWSRLSEKLLIGLKSNDNETIMEKLEKTTMNFMQIINDKNFGFKKQLEELMPKTDKNIKYEDVNEIPTSPANKRAIWQAMCVVNEIAKIMKKPPKNIYIEFARSEEEKVMKDNRAKQLMKKYEEIEKQLSVLNEYDHHVYQELKAHQNDKTLTEKMYLYFIQKGKCLYSGKPLDLDKLYLYEVDHIIPQSYTKDDSIDNKALVIREENQRKKDSLLLSEEIINGRIAWWKHLLQTGLITQAKFYRLTKRKMFETDADREKFVERQLVETRQITKYVTNLLVNQYHDTKVFAIRAELTSGFRKKYKIYKNRNVNNYHHAHDALILSVIGNVLDQTWKGTGEFKYSEYVKKYYQDEISKKEKYGMVLGFVNKHIEPKKVKDTIGFKDCFISRMTIEETGSFYNQTIYSPNENPVIPLKKNLPTGKYGGYSGENKAYFVIFTYINKKQNQEYQLAGIPIKVAYDIKNNKDTEEEYLKREYLQDIKNPKIKILKSHILRNQQYLDENLEPMRLCSDKEIRPDKELILNAEVNELVYLMNSDERNLTDEDKEKVNNGYKKMFNYLLEKLSKEYKVFKTIYEKLLTKSEEFSTLSNSDKKSTINGLIDLMETGQGNLKAVGLGDREGRMSGKTFKNEKLLNMIFVYKSITGMYERRYKIDGVENSCSK